MKHRVIRNVRGGFLLSLLFVMSAGGVAAAASVGVAEAWVRHYHNVISNSHDVASSVVRDSTGNIIVAGHTDDGAGRNGLVFKYSGADGSLLWHLRYNSPANTDNAIFAVAVAPNDNVVVAGRSFNGEDYDYYTAKYSAAGALLWARGYDGPSDDEALAVATDASGNVVVTGGSSQDVSRNDDDGLIRYDYYTAKYAAADGALLWERRYNGPGNGRDRARAVAVDQSDNVVVTGSSVGATDADYYTAKYAGADGGVLWERRYNGPADSVDSAVALALDASGNVVVTGHSRGTNGLLDYYTAKYAVADGALLWEHRYNGPANLEDSAQAVAVDGSGNVVVSGYSLDSWYVTASYTVKYAAADGALLWERRYSAPASRADIAQAVAVDESGNVMVTGYSYNEDNNADFFAAKYAAADGAVLWERGYDGPTNGEDRPAALIVDANGNAVITGSSASGPDPDVYTAKYAAGDGALLWEQRYTGRSLDVGVGECVAVDGSGNVIVTGSSEGNDSPFDYYTAKYSPNGALLWEQRYDSPGHGYDLVRAMALDPDGNPVVTGYSQGEPAFDIYTVKYAASDGAVLWEHRYDGPGHWDDRPDALVVDGSGNVIVSGLTTVLGGAYASYIARYAAADGALQWDRTNSGTAAVAVDAGGNVIVAGSQTVKYAAVNGAVLWSRPFNGGAVAVKVDDNGNVVVTGGAQGYDTVKYAAADGAVLWEKHYLAGAGPRALALDAEGNAIVIGFKGPEVVTVKHASADGALLREWRAIISASGYAVAVDETGNVVVAGFSSDWPDHDYFVAKYAAGDGALLWEQFYDGPAHASDRVMNRSGLALGPNGMVVITGVADGPYGGSYGYGITTVVYREGLAPISIALLPGAVRLHINGEPGGSYKVQRASALAGPWETIATPTAPPNGLIEYMDADPLPGSAFYRTAQP